MKQSSVRHGGSAQYCRPQCEGADLKPDRAGSVRTTALGSWSKMLVRHGTDPRLVLAEVLGVAASEILVKDHPD